MKKILMIIMILMMAAGMAGCGNKILGRSDAMDNPQRFRIESGGNKIGVALVTDRETGVQYLYNVRSGEMVMLVDKDGKPFVSNGWRDYDG